MTKTGLIHATFHVYPAKDLHHQHLEPSSQAPTTCPGHGYPSYIPCVQAPGCKLQGTWSPVPHWMESTRPWRTLLGIPLPDSWPYTHPKLSPSPMGWVRGISLEEMGRLSRLGYACPFSLFLSVCLVLLLYVCMFDFFPSDMLAGLVTDW